MKTSNNKIDINNGTEWVISRSPLLTLLLSGVLCFYSKKKCFGLSPWFITNILSEKIFCCLPMTHLAVNVACEDTYVNDNDKKEEFEPKKQRQKINGGQLWELIQTTAN
ncbi:MAG: hypothetical protein HQK49_20400 [Oligoflexia bacterium]|nr:hypothetical protein [Oligoflexia bacterium]